MKRDLQSIANQWASSGLTQKEFCLKHDIPYQTLQYWLRKSKRLSVAKPGFTEIISSPVELKAEVMELYFANGCRLAFYAKPDSAFVKALIR